jgi:hypothetical protein
MLNTETEISITIKIIPVKLHQAMTFILIIK